MTSTKGTTPRKTGRPIASYRTSQGELIAGLMRLSDGRWRISGRDKITFTEPDEYRAIVRFRAMTAKERPRIAVEPPVVIDGLTFVAEGPPAPHPPRIKWTPDTGTYVTVETTVDEAAFWASVREVILNRPEYAAKKTGIEWLAWHEHDRPVKGETLEAIGHTYFSFSKLSPNELSRSRCFWAEFVKVAKGMSVATVDGINHELAHKYEAYVEGQKLRPKSRLHRYRKVRGILHFAIKRGQSIEHCRKALDVLAMLEVKDAHPLDPTPICVADFWAIHGKAVEGGDATFAAVLLASLNAALYGGEVAAMRWNEIDFTTGGFVSRRSKTGVSRIAVLWPETLTAIKPLPHDREEIFCTKIRSYTVHSVADKFEKYRDEAEVDKSVTFSWIRDAAYSAAMQATDFSKAELLAGHRLPGTADAYLRRNPQLVAVACEAIRQAFDVPQHIAKALAQAQAGARNRSNLGRKARRKSASDGHARR